MALNITLDRNNVYTEGASEQLPVEQAYVCEIKGAKEVDYETTSGYRVHRLDIALDVCEGDYKDYYQKKYDADINEDKKFKGVVKINIPRNDGTEQDGWTIKSFNTQLCAIEDSNAGYTWDNVLDHLKGKKIGLVLRSKEWEFNGNRGFYSEPYKLISVANAKAQKFRKPATKYLNNSGNNAGTAEGFVSITDAVNEELPF